MISEGICIKTVISVTSVLACALSLDAQITATLSRLPNGLDEVRIRNNSATNLAAFAVSVKQTPLSASSSNAPIIVYFDPLIEPATKPLLAGEERTVIAMGMPRSPADKFLLRRLQEPIATAVIYADGTATGDTALLSRLLLRRSNMLLAVETTLEMLSDAGRRNIPREQLIGQFKKMVDSLNHWYLPSEQQVGRSLYQSMIGKLMNLPEGPRDSPFPPSAFVEEETAILRLRRIALSESQPSLLDAGATQKWP